MLGLRSRLYDVKPSLPIVGGGIKQGDLPRLYRDLGTEFIVGAGGAIYAHPDGATAGARAFRQGIDLILDQGNFEKAPSFPELAAALDLWGETPPHD